jgi:hypothetical protein
MKSFSQAILDPNNQEISYIVRAMKGSLTKAIVEAI